MAETEAVLPANNGSVVTGSSSEASGPPAAADATAPTSTPASTATPTSAPVAPSAESPTQAAPRPKVYLPPSASSSSASGSKTPATVVPPLPTTANDPSASSSADEIKPTTEELQALYASTVERNYRMGVNPNAPLMTKAMREREEAKRGGGPGARRQYTEIKIRFRLPDRTILEYNLPASTRLLSLYPLLQSNFTPPSPFVLYTSPPKVEYNENDVKLKSRTLGEMGWGGAAVVQVRFVGQPASLKEELVKEAQVLEPPKMGISDENAAKQQQQQPKPAGRTLGGSADASSDNKEKKIPKWFKGFKK